MCVNSSTVHWSDIGRGGLDESSEVGGKHNTIMQLPFLGIYTTALASSLPYICIITYVHMVLRYMYVHLQVPTQYKL